MSQEILKRPKCPCTKDCPDRTAHCHATCPEHKEYAEAMEHYREELRRRKQLITEADRYAIDQMKQTQTYKRKVRRR